MPICLIIDLYVLSVYLYKYFYLLTSLFVNIYPLPLIYLFTYLCVSICLLTSLSICLHLYPSFYLNYVLIHQAVFLPTYISICPSIYMSFYLSTYLFVNIPLSIDLLSLHLFIFNTLRTYVLPQNKYHIILIRIFSSHFNPKIKEENHGIIREIRLSYLTRRDKKKTLFKRFRALYLSSQNTHSVWKEPLVMLLFSIGVQMSSLIKKRKREIKKKKNIRDLQF